MESCELKYIPQRLHTENRKDIPFFEIGELLFYRCAPEKLEEPFDGIKLYDLSTNREGQKLSPISTPGDVLYNLNPENGKGERLKQAVITLEITEVSAAGTYEKTITHQGLDGENNPTTYKCFIILLHDKLPCNYSHCIFRITLNGTVLTKDNWNNTLGKKTKYISELKIKCKIEIEKMIRAREVRINWE